MDLEEFKNKIDLFVAASGAGFSAVRSSQELEQARIRFLGAKQGELTSIQKFLPAIAPELRREAGMLFNFAKKEAEQSLAQAQQKVQTGLEVAVDPTFDPTLPGARPRIGRVHPITRTIEDLKEIMGRLGFSVAEGPEVEDEWHNFQALNIPASHPARDPLENFYLATAGVTAGPMLLRSQTSTVQIRVMESQPPPVRVVSLGRVYRPDTADATHYPMFHQIEGLLIDRQVTMAELKSTLRLFAESFFGGEVHIRFRPSFFPFTEPSVEVDMTWHQGWIEMGGAGMVDPHVLQAVGYDPEQYSGFAFGLGVERICARRHGVPDIREFYRNDVRFLRQF